METFILSYRELTHSQSYLSKQWPMVSTVTKGSLSHKWIYSKILPRKCGLQKSDHFYWNMNDSVSTCYLRMSFYDTPKEPMGVPFPRGIAPREERENVLHLSLLLYLLPCDVTVERRWCRDLLQGPRHMLLSQAGQCPRGAGGGSCSHKCYNQLVTVPWNTVRQVWIWPPSCAIKTDVWSFLLHITTAPSVIQKHEGFVNVTDW